MATVNSKNDSTTRALLVAGSIGGPLYVIVSLIQAMTREGFDMRHHAFSLLTTGDLGWVQLLNFLISGILIICGAIGLRRVLKGGKGGTWGPWLLGAFGTGTMLAGIFGADPAFGFPPGTSMTAVSISWHGWIHFIAASLGFVCLIAACFVLARRFDGSWKVWTRVLGVILLLALMGVSSGSASSNDFVTPAFIASASIGYLWTAAVAAKFKKEA